MNVLWLDNDAGYLQPYVEALKRRDHDVKVVTSLSAADGAMASGPFDVVLIDVMIPTIHEDEERIYSPEETKAGADSGVVFFRRWREKFREERTAILVLTVRLDKGIRQRFLEEGLLESEFATKLALREVGAFVTKLESQVKNR
jgi:CheY-like chemotaxis protein